MEGMMRNWESNESDMKGVTVVKVMKEERKYQEILQMVGWGGGGKILRILKPSTTAISSFGHFISVWETFGHNRLSSLTFSGKTTQRHEAEETPTAAGPEPTCV